MTVIRQQQVVAEFVKGTKELYPINPTRLIAGVVTAQIPDHVATALVGSDTDDAVFGSPGTLDGGPAVWVQSLVPGTYAVLCKMDAQGDTQAPIWELDFRFRVRGTA